MKNSKIFGDKETKKITKVLEEGLKVINKPLINSKRFQGSDIHIFQEEEQFIRRQDQVEKFLKEDKINYEQKQVVFQDPKVKFELNEIEHPQQINTEQKIIIRGVTYDKNFILPRYKSCPNCGRVSSEHPNCQKTVFTNQVASGTRGFRYCLRCNKHRGQIRANHDCFQANFTLNKLIIQSRDQELVQKFLEIGKIRRTYDVLTDPGYMLGVWEGICMKFPRLRTTDDYKCMQFLQNLQVSEGKTVMFSKTKINENIFLPQNYYQVCKLMGVLAAVKLNKSTLLMQDLFRFDWTVFRNLLKIEKINYIDIMTSLEGCTQMIWYITQTRIEFIQKNIQFFQIQELKNIQTQHLENIISGNIQVKPFSLKKVELEEFKKVKELMRNQNNKTWVVQDVILQKMGVKTSFLFNLFYAQLFFSKIDLKQFRRVYKSFDPLHWVNELKQRKQKQFKRINYMCDRTLLTPEKYAKEICEVQQYLYKFKSTFNFWRKIIISWKQSNTNSINLKGEKYTFQQRREIFDFIKYGNRPSGGNYYRTSQIQSWANYNCFLAFPICRWDVKFDIVVKINSVLAEILSGFVMDEVSLKKKKNKFMKLHQEILGVLPFYRLNYGNKIMAAVFKQFQLIICLKRKARVFQKYQEQDNQYLWRSQRQGELLLQFKQSIELNKQKYLTKQIIKAWQSQIQTNLKVNYLQNFTQRYKLINNCVNTPNYKIQGLVKEQNQFIRSTKSVILERKIQNFIMEKMKQQNLYDLDQKIKRQLKINFYQLLVQQKYLIDLMETQFYQDPTLLLLFFSKQSLKVNRWKILRRTPRQLKLLWNLAKKDVRLLKILFSQQERYQIFENQFYLFGQNPLLKPKQDLRLWLYTKDDSNDKQIAKRKLWCINNFQMIYDLFLQEQNAQKCLRQWVELYKIHQNKNIKRKLFQIYNRLQNGWGQLSGMIFRFIYCNQHFLNYHQQEPQQIIQEPNFFDYEEKVIDHVLQFSSQSPSSQAQIMHMQQQIRQKSQKANQPDVIEQNIERVDYVSDNYFEDDQVLSKRKLNQQYQQVVVTKSELQCLQQRIDLLSQNFKKCQTFSQLQIQQIIKQVNDIKKSPKFKQAMQYIKEFYQNQLVYFVFLDCLYQQVSVFCQKFYQLKEFKKKGFMSQLQNKKILEGLYLLHLQFSQFLSQEMSEIVIVKENIKYKQLQVDHKKYTFNLLQYIQQSQLQKIQEQKVPKQVENTKNSKKGPNVLVFNNTTNEFLLYEDSKKKVDVASIIKILVFLVVQQIANKKNINIYNQMFMACKFQQFMQSSAKILHNKYSIYQYLVGMLVPSGCDATYNIQSYLKKMKINLKQQMLRKCKQLHIQFDFQQVAGCQKTRSTLKNVLTLFKQAIKSELFMKIIKTKSFNNHRQYVQSTSLQLIKLDIFGKTGTSDFINGSHYVGVKNILGNEIIIITQGMYSKSINFQYIIQYLDNLKITLLKKNNYSILELQKPKFCSFCQKIFNYNVNQQSRGQCNKCKYKILPKQANLFFSSGQFICQKGLIRNMGYKCYLTEQNNNLRMQITKRFPNSKIIQNFIYVGQLASKKFYCNTQVLDDHDSYEISQSILNWQRLPLQIQYINQQIGQGVFATQDIPKNTVLGTYCGQVYSISQIPGFENNSLVDLGYIDNKLLLVCPEKCVNHGRFFNGEKKNVNMSVNRTFFMYQQKVVFGLVCVTIKLVKKGQEIKWKYGENYWKNK